MSGPIFRRARTGDRGLLDEMTVAGVRHWGHHHNHPEAYSALVAALQAAEDPEGHPVWVLEERGEPLGFYELRDRGGHVELLRMFVRTDLIGSGHGRTLWDHAIAEAARTHDRMLIESDPEAIGFYRAMGAELEVTVEPVPGFTIGRLWYDLTGA